MKTNRGTIIIKLFKSKLINKRGRNGIKIYTTTHSEWDWVGIMTLDYGGCVRQSGNRDYGHGQGHGDKNLYKMTT